VAPGINRTFTRIAQRVRMDPSGLPLFDLAEQRLAWTDRRQEVLAQNIANLNTPHWQAKDLRPFAAALADVTGPTLARTDPGHLAGTQDTAAQSLLTLAPGTHQPDGNAVSLDDQLTKVADTATAQEIATTLYKKYLSMFSLALGYGQ
jgi:flagellar basal-body rod protein FlgB